MGQSKKIANQTRQEEKEEVPEVNSKWSEVCLDLLKCVFKRLSFTELNRAKSVCSSWYSVSKGCVPKPNQIPWLILFPHKEKGNNNSSSCVLFIPEDKHNVFKTRDLGVGFVQSRCLATYGSWLLMMYRFSNNLYILNPLTGERIDLPRSKSTLISTCIPNDACLWIDNKTKDYLVVWRKLDCTVFTKKEVNKWHEFPEWFDEFVYNQKNQKLYAYYRDNYSIKIWDFSGDKPHKDGVLDRFRLNRFDFRYWENLQLLKIRLVVTVSGDVLVVSYCRLQDYKEWRFRIYEEDHVNQKWVRIDYLGDEALILDMGITVVAKDTPGIKRNSIYFCGVGHGRNDPDNIFVYDITTQNSKPLPQCVFSDINFSDARWFFPC